MICNKELNYMMPLKKNNKQLKNDNDTNFF